MQDPQISQLGQRRRQRTRQPVPGEYQCAERRQPAQLGRHRTGQVGWRRASTIPQVRTGRPSSGGIGPVRSFDASSRLRRSGQLAQRRRDRPRQAVLRETQNRQAGQPAQPGRNADPSGCSTRAPDAAGGAGRQAPPGSTPSTDSARVPDSTNWTTGPARVVSALSGRSNLARLTHSNVRQHLAQLARNPARSTALPTR